MSKITYVTINPDKRKGGVGKNGIIDSPTLPRDNDRRRGNLEAPVTVAWSHAGVGQGGEIRIDLPNRDGAPIDQNRDASFKTGDLLLLHVQTYNTITRPSGWEDVPNGQFTVAGIRHYYWWRRITGTEAGVWVISNDDPFDQWVMYGIRGAVATGDPFYSTALESVTNPIEVTAEKRGDLYFAFGFPDTFGSYPLSVPEVELDPKEVDDELLSFWGYVTQFGNTDGDINTTEAQNQGFLFNYNPKSKDSPDVEVTGTGQVFSGFVRWEKKKQVLDVTGSIGTTDPLNAQRFFPLKGDLLIGVWFNDGDFIPNSLESYSDFWPSYFTEFDIAIPSIEGVSVHAGYRRITDADFEGGVDSAISSLYTLQPQNAVYLRNASEKVELIGTGGGSNLISLLGSTVQPTEFVILFTVFAQPHYSLDGGFLSPQLTDLSLSMSALDLETPGLTKFGETGSRIYASTAIGEGIPFSASYVQSRPGGLPTTESRTFAIKVRRK